MCWHHVAQLRTRAALLAALTEGPIRGGIERCVAGNCSSLLAEDGLDRPLCADLVGLAEQHGAEVGEALLVGNLQPGRNSKQQASASTEQAIAGLM